MKDVGKNKKVPLIVLLVIFVIGSVYVCVAVPGYLLRANTSYYEYDFFSTDISFTEDIKFIDTVSLTRRQIEDAMGNKELSEINTVTIQKGKKYKLKSDLMIFTKGEKREYRDQFKIVFDDHKSHSVDLYSHDGKTEEFHNEYLDGTYYTDIPMSKAESYEELLSEYKKAKDDYIASQRRSITMSDILSVIVPLAVSLAISAVVLIIHRVLTVKGISATPLVVLFAILDVPLVLLSVFFLLTL
ncbi:MAG: hypothetical protein IKT20_01870 [Clostridiales bacterium]|nr:hypothetical protein [Clostridiales bacterium]MBR6487635.1 hypothetical protein [Clostridiales bacterium]